VHDENTWALAGVAPHAGLFGTIDAVADWGLKLRAAVLNDSKRFGDPSMVRRFVKRQIPPRVGDWGLGFMKPSKGTASCGRYFSPQSFGHTGFTGTSLWMDPKNDVLVLIFSNRVHPTRKNSSFVGLRGSLHNWIVESL
jgi:CubicO group peptidase (beta-lactamase class C family)